MRMCGMIPLDEAARRSRSENSRRRGYPSARRSASGTAEISAVSGVVANVAERNARILYRGTDIATCNEPKA
jgi:hypothetical protein